MWIHSGFKNCGYEQMTTQQKQLFNEVTGRTEGARTIDQVFGPAVAARIREQLHDDSPPELSALENRILSTLAKLLASALTPVAKADPPPAEV